MKSTGALVGSLQGNNNHHERCAKVPVNQARAQSRNYRFLGFAHYRKLVFCFQNCSDLLWEKLVLVFKKIRKSFDIRGRICKMVEITRTICYNSMSVKFWNKILFQLVTSIYNVLEQLTCHPNKTFGCRNLRNKFENTFVAFSYFFLAVNNNGLHST